MNQAADIPGLIFREFPDGTLHVSFRSVPGREKIDADTIRNAVATSAYAHYRLDDGLLASVISLYNNQDDNFTLQIGRLPPPRMALEIAPDRMAAFLSIAPQDDVPPLTAEQIGEFLQQQGIRHGLMQDDIDRIARTGGTGEGFLVAQGTPPQTGADGELESLIGELQQRHRKLNQHGVADFRELGNLVVVQPGEALMRRLPPKDGTPGTDVFGEPVAAEPGKIAVFPICGQGVQVAPDDPDRLVASISGQPLLDSNKVEVEPVLTVKGVNLATGNIDFEGTVNVQGDVVSGMSIKAGGDVVINGTLEAASIQAGGDIRISGGIKGHSEGRGIDHMQLTDIRAKGSIHANFTENAHLVAGENIQIGNVAMQSELEAGRQVIVGKPGSKGGHILGCKVRALQLVQAGVIGSNTGVLTLIEVGTDPSEGRILRALQQKLAVLQHGVSELVKMRDFYLAHSEKAKPDMMQKIDNTLNQRNGELAELQQETDAQLAQQKFTRSAKVIAEKALHGNVRITIGSTVQEVAADKLHPVVCHLDPQRPRILFE